MAQASSISESNPKLNLVRCLDWLQKQNDPKKLLLQNKNDIQFIIETNAHRKKFLLSAAEDDASVPAGVDEPALKPKSVPIRRLRVDRLCMECEWQSCNKYYSNYVGFQKHVIQHTSDLHVINNNGTVEYVCLWDVCGHKTEDFVEMVRHINYHAYHARLLAIGFNGRATLKLERCRKDSSKRNQLPPLKYEHCCMWVGCTLRFNSIQIFFDHIHQHVRYSEENLCSWAGCGAKFSTRTVLNIHIRSHTHERLIACYHCGQHFSRNEKLSNHLARQNVVQEAGYQCGMCGNWFATEYLVREHARQHVSAYACALCDMTAPTPAALALHVRYRHMQSTARPHACPSCPYRAVTKCDLRKHIKTHNKKIKNKKKESDGSGKDVTEDDSEEEVKKVAEKRQYACHMCPGKQVAVFSRGRRLTMHLVKVHGAQWPFGHSRFRYQISDDGIYRLTTTRFEVLEVSKKIVDGYRDPKESLNNSYEFDLKQTAEATETTPRKFEITLKGSQPGGQPGVQPGGQPGGQPSVQPGVQPGVQPSAQSSGQPVEIEMCDVDEKGNIIKSETIESNVLCS